MPNLQIIREILEDKNISIKDFCKDIAMSEAGLKRIMRINSTRIQTLELIAEKLNVPIQTLFNGNYNIASQNKNLKPHIPTYALAGSLSDYTQSFDSEMCENNPRVPTFGEYDFTIDVKGDSMNDLYQSGDIVACKFISNPNDIKYGKVYIIDSAQGVIMKQIEKVKNDPSQLRCISFNPDYPEFLIQVEDIYTMSQVVGVIKSNV